MLTRLSLPTIAVNACDLSILPTAVFGSSMSVCSELPRVDYTDLLNDIKIEKLSQDLKESHTKATRVLESRLPPVQTGNPSAPGFASAGLSTGLGASVNTKPIDRSCNVIVFGVPESRSLLDTET